MTYSGSSSTDKTALRQHEIDTQLAGLRSHSVNLRANAARRLGEMQAEIDALIETVNDPSEFVRGAAVVALGNFSNSDRISEIIDVLLTAIDDASEKVCQAAIRSLGILHAEVARPEIEEFVDDPNPYIQGAAVLALGRLGAVDQGEKFAAMLGHENNYVKMQAARAVGLLKYTPASPQIVHLLQITRQARLAAGQPDLNSRLERREDDLYSLQNHLIRTAGELRITEAAPLLIEIAQKDIGLRGLAVEALIEIGSEVAPALLSDLLNDPSTYLRRRMIAMMTQFNYAPALPLLRPLLLETSASIRSAALQAVSQMRDAESLPQIRWMSVHDSNPFVRVQALLALDELLGRESVPLLILLAGDTNYQVRREAVTRLLHWAPPDQSALAAMAQYAHEFPDDDLFGTIQAHLTSHEYTPDNVEPTNGPALLIPSEINSEAPDLLNLLQRWQGAIHQMGALSETTSDTLQLERRKIDDSLSCLIEILKEYTKTQAE